MTAGAEHSRELGEHGSQVRDVLGRQPTDDEIDGLIGDREPAYVALQELRAGNFHPRHGQHAGRAVDTDHPVTE